MPGARARIVMLAGGGLGSRSGGVGTLTLYLLQTWAGAADAPLVRVIDTRGAGGRAMMTACFISSVFRLGWILLRGQADLVHAHMTTRGSAIRKCLLCGLAMAFGVPVIVHMHGADFFPFVRRLPRLLRWPLHAVLRRAWRVIVLGAAWRRCMIDELGVAPAKLAIIHNGVPRPVMQARPASQGPARILFLGRLCARKGVPELIDALADPRLSDDAWRATLAGDGAVAATAERVRTRGLAARIAVLDWVDRARAAALLAEADILVLPSHHEAMPVAILEALAARVAVIATPVGAIGECLTDQVSALLVPPGDAAALATAMRRLIDNPADRRRLAEAGHRVFLEQGDIARTAASLQGLYRAALLRTGNSHGPVRLALEPGPGSP